jgi:hypothetical protein
MGHFSWVIGHWSENPFYLNFIFRLWFGRIRERGYFLQNVSTIKTHAIPDRNPEPVKWLNRWERYDRFDRLDR